MTNSWRSAFTPVFVLAAAVGMAVVPATSEAGPIISAVSASATNSWPDLVFGNPDNLINQGGLATPYVSGVTDFDAYMALDPMHTPFSVGAEWFTGTGDTGSTLTFDLGATTTIDRLALWTDEFWGAGLVDVWYSLDGVSYTAAGSFAPTDWPADPPAPYGADVFAFGSATSTRFVQLVLSGCPQPDSIPGGGCGLGEIAFASTEAVDPAAVPEPMTLLLVGSGLAGIASRRRKLVR